MNFDELSALTAKQPEAPSACEISKLADVDLAAIFKRLPPIDRLLVSEVCKRWHAIAKQAWLEITQLDLSPIPGPNIAPIVSLCSNLRDVFAVRKTFDLNELHIFSRINLSSLKLHECTSINIPAKDACRNDPLVAVFSSNLRHASLDELVLHDLRLHFSDHDLAIAVIQFPASLPASLRRLLITGVNWYPSGYNNWDSPDTYLKGIEQLQGLDCLIFLSCQSDYLIWNVLFDPGFPTRIGWLLNLRELALGTSIRWGWEHSISTLAGIFRLARLEALFLDNFAHLDRLRDRDDFVRLVTKHSALRILVLTGYVGYNIQFPPRVLYGNGFSAAPLPQLHIFVGKKASENIQFPKFSSVAAKVYPISCPLPQFLEREDIKPIFEGAWIAEKIKEAAKQGAEFCDYAGDLATSFRSSDT